MATPLAAPSALKHLPVLDAPSPWVQQLLDSADPSTRSCLFKSCRLLRDMLLGGCNKVRLHHNLNEDLTGTATMASLQRLTGCKRGAQVKLVIDASKDKRDESVQAALLAAAWLSNLCVTLSLSSGLPLHRITCLKLKGMITDELVPPSVNAACPNLRHIKHHDYRPWTRTSRMGSCPIPCSQVIRLSVKCKPIPRGIHAGEAAEAFKKQLQTLSNHQELTLDAWEYDKQLLAYWDLGIRGLRLQLTRLKVVDLRPIPCVLKMCWPQLQCLNVFITDMGIDEFKQLSASTPRLQQLAVLCFRPYEHPICAGDWLNLLFPNLRRMHVRELTVEDLANAPLKGLDKLEFAFLTVRECDMPLITRAIANLMSCSYVGGDRFDVIVQGHNFADQAILPALVCLFEKLQFHELGLDSSLLPY